MKTALLLVVGLVLFTIPLLAGEYLMNEDAALGLRVVFSETVTISGFGDVFTTVEPQGEATEFVFSGAELDAWGSHWLNWEPASALLLEHEWLTQIPAGTADIAIVGHSETATVFEVDLAPSSSTPALRQVLIDDFENPALESRFGGSYGWGAGSGDRTSNCEIIWIPQGVSGGHVLFEYENRSWLKVGLWGLQEPLDAAGFDGIEVALWSDEPCSVEVEIGTWDEAYKCTGYVSERLGVDEVPRTFRVPFDSFSAYDSRTTGVPQAHLARVIALSLFPRNAGGRLYLDNLGLYGQDPAIQDPSTVSGETLRGTITRYVSSERIPFWVRYECDFPEIADLDFQWEADSGKEEEYEVARGDVLTSRSMNPKFLLMSNAESTDVRLLISDAEGHRYDWQDLAVDIPLHNLTEIALDATQFVPEEEIESVRWTAENGDPDDAKTFPITKPTARITTLVSEWPNMLTINCEIETQDGTSINKQIDALIYFRDGTPFEVRSTAATVFDPTIPLNKLAELLEVMFSELRRLGFNAVTIAINWWYGYPDEQGVFTIHPIYDSTWRARGGTISPDQLQMYLTIATEAGFPVYVQITQFNYRNDEALGQDYHQSGWGTYSGFRNTDGFLYGDGQGYENMLLHCIPVFTEHSVPCVFLGAEVGNMERHGGEKIRSFYQDIIAAYRTGGYGGAISYASAYSHNPDWPEMPPFPLENLSPSGCGIPWGDMNYVSLTFYPTLTNSFEASTEDMHEEALAQIAEYLRPFHDVHDKPLFIEDFYCFAYDGCAIRPVDQDWQMHNAYDPEEQRRWHVAWLRAFAEENLQSPTPWIKGITMYQYWLNPWIADAPFRARAMGGSVNAAESEHLRLLAKVFFRDLPLHGNE